MSSRTYRLYRFNRGGDINLVDCINARSDQAAIEKARHTARGAQSAEIWIGSRRVAKLSDRDLSPDHPRLQNAVADRLMARARRMRREQVN